MKSLFILAALVAQGAEPFQLNSPAFPSGGEIPPKFTCEGENISPPLQWTGAPLATKSFALLEEDPDVPDPHAPKMIWVHWIAYNIPSSNTSLGEGMPLPHGAAFGLNDWKKEEYGGPCPPIGRHRYFHKLYALDTVLNLHRATKSALLSSMKAHILGTAELIGTYQKKAPR
jgi:Raf kinase inhibitor-like YbhB/YbcL family protein